MRTAILYKSLAVWSLVAGTCVLAPAQSAPQASTGNEPTQITVHQAFGSPTDPVRILQVKLGDIAIPLDTPISVEGMWLRGLRVVVQNVSSKPLTRIEVSVDLPESGGSDKPNRSITLSLGRLPKHALLQKEGTERTVADDSPEISVPPCGTVTLEATRAADSEQIAAYKAAHISKVQLSFLPVYFNDESRWAAGDFFVAVPAPALWRKAPDVANQSCSAQ